MDLLALFPVFRLHINEFRMCVLMRRYRAQIFLDSSTSCHWVPVEVLVDFRFSEGWEH